MPDLLTMLDDHIRACEAHPDGVVWTNGEVAALLRQVRGAMPSEEEIAEALVNGYESDAPRLQGVNKHDLRAARAVRGLLEKKMLGS